MRGQAFIIFRNMNSAVMALNEMNGQTFLGKQM